MQFDCTILRKKKLKKRIKMKKIFNAAHKLINY